MNAREEVLAAEARRAAALLKADVAALGELVDDALTYTHATGVRHDRGGWLDYVMHGPSYLEVRLDAQDVQVLGDVALVSGELELHLRRANGETVRARSLVTQVWVRRGGRWRLRAMQSTRLPESSQ